MTSTEIKDYPFSRWDSTPVEDNEVMDLIRMGINDCCSMLQEIAYQLAVKNERAADRAGDFTIRHMHICPACNYSRPFAEWPAGVPCASCEVLAGLKTTKRAGPAKGLKRR